MQDSVFRHPEKVRSQLKLPSVIRYSIVGPSTPAYHARLESLITRLVGDANIRHRQYRKSSKGTYTAYRFDIFHDNFEDVEEMYRIVGRLEGTRFMI